MEGGRKPQNPAKYGDTRRKVYMCLPKMITFAVMTQILSQLWLTLAKQAWLLQKQNAC